MAAMSVLWHVMSNASGCLCEVGKHYTDSVIDFFVRTGPDGKMVSRLVVCFNEYDHDSIGFVQEVEAYLLIKEYKRVPACPSCVKKLMGLDEL